MHIPAIVAFAVGLVLGVWFRPLSIVAACVAFVTAIVAFGSGFGWPPVLASLVAVIALNVGYLVGALAARRRSRRSETDTFSSDQ